VLFSDLAGSTALAERLDPEDVRAMQTELVELIGRHVEAHGGTVEKFAGDAVLAVFGAPQAHEDDAERAVRAALAVHEAFPAFAARLRACHGVDVDIRTGVNTGEVVAGHEAIARGELMVSGDAVNTAARLQQHAEAGTILVGERTFLATERAIAYRPTAPVDAKGKSAPVAAWVADAVRPQPARRGVAGLEAPLIGRAREMTLLRALAERVERERAPQLVTLFGHAGVGKSRLVHEFTTGLDDARLLRGRCLPYGDGITYWPLAEIAKSHAAILDTDPAQTAASKLTSAIGTVVGDAHGREVADIVAASIGLEMPGLRPEGADPDATRSAIRGAWARYLAALGRDRFTVVVVEDIHWAAQAMIDLLDGLAETLDETAVMLVCPSRPELLDTRPLWGAGRQNATAINLAPLAPDDARRLVGALLDVDRLHVDVRERILARAEGNPFFVEEILRMLIERGVLERANGDWHMRAELEAVDIPDSVHAVIAARIDLLVPAARSALRRCAVVGRVFWPEAVDAAPADLDVLARRGLVSERPESAMAGSREFTFKHALTRDVAYASLARAERWDIHLRVARWITRTVADRAGEVAELTAYHYAQALATGRDDPDVRRDAVAAFLAAGESALARAAPENAVPHLELALRHADTPVARGRAELALARVDLALFALDSAHRRLAAALEDFTAAGDPHLCAEAFGWMSRACWLSGRWPEALDAGRKAVDVLADLPESPALARALARHSQVEMLRGNADAAGIARRAIETARRVNDGFAEVNASINLFTALGQDGVVPPIGDVEALVTAALELGAPDEAYRAVVNALWTHAEAGEPIAELERLMGSGRELLAAYEPPEVFGDYLDLSAAKFVDVPAGRWAKASQTLDAHDRSRLRAGPLLVWLELRTAAALRRGDVATADRYLPQAVDLSGASGEPQRIVPVAVVRVWRAAIAGDVSAATAAVAHMLSQAHGLKSTRELVACRHLLRGLLHAGGPAAVAPVARELEGMGSHAANRQARIWQAVLAGMIALGDGRPDDAVTALGRALELEVERGASYYAATSRLDLATALEATGRGDDAAEERAKAAQVLEPLGCVYPV
jgi:class 3 adenylate cyclase/tetratricopeptide (TPR) repeat protein